MNAFIVEIENRPGEMARVTEVLASQRVNVLVSSIAIGARGGIGFVANNEELARSALKGARIAYREVPVLHVRMEDKPGQTASASRQLANVGVNIEVWLPVNTAPDNFIVAVGVDKVEAAKKALGKQVTTWSYH